MDQYKEGILFEETQNQFAYTCTYIGITKEWPGWWCNIVQDKFQILTLPKYSYEWWILFAQSVQFAFPEAVNGPHIGVDTNRIVGRQTSRMFTIVG